MNYMDIIPERNKRFFRKAGMAPFLIIFCFLLCLNSVEPYPCYGKEATNVTGELSLSLRKCIELMLNNNLDLKVEQYNPYLQEKEIIKEKAAFDPLARFSLQDKKMVVSPTTLINGVGPNKSYEQKTMDYEFSLSKKLITGGLGELKFTTNKYDTNSLWQYINPTYYSNLVFSLNQPLLRNFGINLNKSRIMISSNNKNISQTRLRDKTITMITNLQQIYWNLYLSQQIFEVNKASLQLAKNLMERNKAFVEVGKLPSVEILRARTGVASREEAVILAENSMDDAEDLLMENLNLPLQDQTIILIDKPNFNEFSPRKEEVYLKTAFGNRPDHEEATIYLENLKVTNKIARNAMLPIFDLQASYGINAIKGSYDKSVSRMNSSGDYSWLVGFKMEIPLGNRWAKSNYQKSKLEMEKAETTLKSLERKIELEVKSVLRKIESSHKRISATQEAQRLAEKNLEAEEERMNLGMSTSVEVLRVQEELTAAKCNATKAIVDYINSLNNFDKVLGKSPETYQIEFQDKS